MRNSHTIAFIVLVCGVGTSPAAGSPFASSVESWEGGTDRLIYQLTTEPGHNNALYFHQSNTNGALELVYANIIDRSQTSTLTHRKLDLETGADTAIHPTGECAGGAFVRDQYMYCFHRDPPFVETTPFTEISRYHLGTPADPTDLCQISAGWSASGSIAVNLDGSYLIYTQEQLDSKNNPTRRQAFRCHISSGTSTLLMDTNSPDLSPLIEHFQFHTAHPMWFTYVDRGRARRISRIGVGRIDTLQYGPLQTPDPTIFNDDPVTLEALFPESPDGPDPEGQDFAHPVYAQDGTLWSDMIDIYDGSKPKYMVRFTLVDSAPGLISGFSRVPLLSTMDWQQHSNAGNDGQWFVGDGGGTSIGFLGDDFIHRMRFDAWTGSGVIREKLAKGVGTHDKQLDSSGNPTYFGPNAHYVSAKRWVVWSAFRTLAGGVATDENVFAVGYNPPVDVDDDGSPDFRDNCTIYANTDQIDADGDGYGNRCDADIDQNQVIDSADSAIIQACIDLGGTVPLVGGGGPTADPTCEISDLDESSTVDTWDLVVVLQLYFQGKIGPTCAGNDPCFP